MALAPVDIQTDVSCFACDKLKDSLGLVTLIHDIGIVHVGLNESVRKAVFGSEEDRM